MFLAENRQPIGVTITGGVSWHVEPDDRYQWHVSKIMLVGTVQRFLQSGRLRIGAKLTHAGTLQKELRDFRVKISKAANETYEAREGQHDDIVLGLAIALFVAEHQGPPAAGLSPETHPEIMRAWAQREAAEHGSRTLGHLRSIWTQRLGHVLGGWSRPRQPMPEGLPAPVTVLGTGEPGHRWWVEQGAHGGTRCKNVGCPDPVVKTLCYQCPDGIKRWGACARHGVGWEQRSA